MDDWKADCVVTERNYKVVCKDLLNIMRWNYDKLFLDYANKVSSFISELARKGIQWKQPEMFYYAYIDMVTGEIKCGCQDSSNFSLPGGTFHMTFKVDYNYFLNMLKLGVYCRSKTWWILHDEGLADMGTGYFEKYQRCLVDYFGTGRGVLKCKEVLGKLMMYVYADIMNQNKKSLGLLKKRRITKKFLEILE